MNSALLTVVVVLATMAALIHVAIFFLESVLWERPGVWHRFGLRSQAEAAVVRPMAFNQGFYNLFLAVGTGIGPVLIGTANQAPSPPPSSAGLWLLLFSLSSMVLASLVLLATDRRFWRAALIQGALPAFAIAGHVMGLVTP